MFWVAKPATDFFLPDMMGEIHQRLDYRERAYIVSFWATWCSPCIKELPDLQRAAEILGAFGPGLPYAETMAGAGTAYFIYRQCPGIVVARVVGGIDWDELSILAQVRSLISVNQNDAVPGD
ncbi:MAG: TlpA disulfide reductase family protein [Candidatus Thiodiazotropha sp.]